MPSERTMVRIPDSIRCAADYARAARRHLGSATWAHIAEGTGTQRTLRANRDAFARHAILPRVLVPCARGHTRLRLLGRTLAHPFLLAPVSLHALVHPLGELATAEGAAASDTTMIISTLASMPIADIARRATAGRWFQLYIQPQERDTRTLLAQAEAAGCEAVVVTVDAPVTGPRPHSARRRFAIPPHVRAANVPTSDSPAIVATRNESRIFQRAMAAAPDWSTLAAVIAATHLPVLVKGVLHPDDALRALDCGATGIVVSNHGGRALDGVPASLDCVPAVRNAVGPSVPLLLDGGIRSGNDAFVALALGADAVLVGRLQLYALAVAGALGVAHLLRTLREELELTMALAGCPTLAAITPAHLQAHGPAAMSAEASGYAGAH